MEVVAAAERKVSLEVVHMENIRLAAGKMTGDPTRTRMTAIGSSTSRPDWARKCCIQCAVAGSFNASGSGKTAYHDERSLGCSPHREKNGTWRSPEVTRFCSPAGPTALACRNALNPTRYRHKFVSRPRNSLRVRRVQGKVCIPLIRM